MIELDGSFCEGGGQIVRTALALSCLTKRPFKVKDIRKGRDKPGLKAQHLKCIEILKELSDAFVQGDKLGSEDLLFYPRTIKVKDISQDIETAGSITLLLQSLLPFLIFQKKRIKLNLKGGTDVKWSMPYDYFANVLISQLRRFASIDCKLLRRGYFPKGSGEIELIIRPKEKRSINLTEQGDLTIIKGISSASKSLQERNVAERMSQTAELMLKRLNTPISISNEYSDSLSDGCGITLFAIYSKNDEINLNPVRLGSSFLGEKGKTSEQISETASNHLIKGIDSLAPVDEFLADNLIPFMAVVGGEIKTTTITNHTRSNIYVVEKFLDVKFEINETTKVIKVEPTEFQF